MSKAPADTVMQDRLERFKACPECGAGFDQLTIGGQGDWKKTITCEKCFHVQRGLSHESVIIPLIAQQYGISIPQAREVEELLESEYMEILEGISESFRPV